MIRPATLAIVIVVAALAAAGALADPAARPDIQAGRQQQEHAADPGGEISPYPPAPAPASGAGDDGITEVSGASLTKQQLNVSAGQQSGGQDGPQEQPIGPDERTAGATEDIAAETANLFAAAVADFFVSIVGIGALVFTIYQTRRAVGAAAKSASAAQAAVKVAQENAYTELRAYVHAPEATMRTVDSRYEITVQIGNYGRTPAHDVCTYIGWRFVVAGESVDLGDVDLAEPTPAPLAPGARIELPVYLSNLDVPDSVFEGSSAFHVYGRVEYVDAWGRPHVTCLHFICDSNRPGPLIFAGVGNTAD